MSKDYYKVLGVERNANEADIKKAYRKLAHQYHPDKKGGDEAKFKEVNEAYSILGNKDKRAQYDQFGSMGGAGFGQGGFQGGFNPNDFGFDFSNMGGGEFDMGDLGDILASMFGGRRVRRGRDVAVDIELSFEESIFGTDRKVVINSKFVKQKEVSIKVPAGIDDGQMIRMSGFGETIDDGVPGDLYIKVHVRKHPHIKKEGYNLIMDLEIKLTDALLGHDEEIKTLDGNIVLKVPQGTNTGTVLRVKGKGVPTGNKQRGDLYVRVKVKMPEKLSKTERKLIEELKKEGL